LRTTRAHIDTHKMLTFDYRLLKYLYIYMILLFALYSL